MWWCELDVVFEYIHVLCLQEVSYILRGNFIEILLKWILRINFIIVLGMVSEGKKGTRWATKMTSLTKISH